MSRVGVAATAPATTRGLASNITAAETGFSTLVGGKLPIASYN